MTHQTTILAAIPRRLTDASLTALSNGDQATVERLAVLEGEAEQLRAAHLANASRAMCWIEQHPICPAFSVLGEIAQEAAHHGGK